MEGPNRGLDPVGRDYRRLLHAQRADPHYTLGASNPGSALRFVDTRGSDWYDATRRLALWT